MQIQRELIQKYNKPVPRYTSYPPANFFSDEFTSDHYLAAIKASNNEDPKNISFYIHIPFCKKLCFYCGCNSCPLAKHEDVDSYIKALKKEISLVIPLLDKQRKVSQIHYGGGTPNSINVKYLKEINQIFFDAFTFIDQPEIAIECHPAYLDADYIKGLHDAGFNRFSLGIQDFKPEVLKAVNREGSALPVADLIKLLKEKNNSSVNLDFIYGLPFQSKESFVETIEKAIQANPDRLVTFSYAHVPWVNKAQLALEKKGLPDGNMKIDMTEAAYNLLSNSGYEPIGMDHFVKSNDELFLALQKEQLHRNFQGYCTKRTTGQVYAFGVSGISQLQSVYAQNTKSIEEYKAALNSDTLPVSKGYKLTDNEVIIRSVITDFMCNKSVSLKKHAEVFSISLENLKSIIRYNIADLEEFAQDAIIEFTTDQVILNPDGLPFIRNIAASFDPKLNNSGKTFSKAV